MHCTRLFRSAAALLCGNRRRFLPHLDERMRLRVQPLVPAVIVCIRGKPAPAQQAAHQLGHRAVKHSEQRYTDRHAHKAEHAAEQEDRKHDPEARQSGRVAQNLGPKDVAVKLLQGEDEQHEIDRLDRADHHDQDGARDRANERPEKRDDVGHAHDHRDQQRKRLVHRHQAEADKQPQADKAQYADNQRVDQLAGDEPAEYTVHIGHAPHNAVRPANREQAVRDLFGLRTKGVLAVQDIERNDNADQDIEQHGNRGYHTGHQLNKLRQCNILHPVHDLLRELVIDLHKVALDHRVILKQRRHPAGYLVQIGVHGFQQGKNAHNQLRQHHPEQDADHRNANQQRQDAAQPFGNARAVFQSLREPRLDTLIQRVKHRRKQIGHHKAVNERA